MPHWSISAQAPATIADETLVPLIDPYPSGKWPATFTPGAARSCFNIGSSVGPQDESKYSSLLTDSYAAQEMLPVQVEGTTIV